MLINQNITSLFIVKKGFFKNKIFKVLLLKNEEELEHFNNDNLETKLKKLSEMTKILLKKIKNDWIILNDEVN